MDKLVRELKIPSIQTQFRNKFLTEQVCSSQTCLTKAKQALPLQSTYAKRRFLYNKFTFAIWLFCITSCIYADQVVLKNGNVLKGIVVEEYHDRIILSVPYGQLPLYRSQITDIIYDRPGQNFMKMGNKYFKEGDIEKAIEYYRKALKIEPNFEDAKDAIARVEDKQKKTEQLKREGLERKKEILDSQQIKKEREVQKLKETLGLEIEKYGNDVRVVYVYPRTPASKSGIKRDDIIVSIWDVSIKYQKIDKVVELLIGEKGSSITLTVEREISPVRKKIRWYEKAFVGIGISLKVDKKGLIVSEVLQGQPGDIAGLKVNDCVVAIKGKSTRYMTLKDAIRNMAGAELTPLKLTVHRRIRIVRSGADESHRVSERDSVRKKVTVEKKEKGGIGVRISQVSDGIKVSAVSPQLPAGKAGVKSNDLFVEISGKATKNMSIEEAVNLLRGKPNTYIEVMIERKLSIVRKKLPGTNFAGIGCSLATEEIGLRINNVQNGGPAERAGVQKGDIIVKLGNKVIKGVPFSELVDKIRGKKGTTLVITIRRKIRIKRASI